MDKQLLDKIDQALTAQQETIQRQQAMLNDKDKDIAELQNLLKQLAATQTEQLERLPTLYEQLKNTIAKQRDSQALWMKHRKEYNQSMSVLTEESLQLAERQIRLIKLMKEYQSTIVPPETLKADTERLESELDELETSQQKIIKSQALLEKQQKRLIQLLDK